MVKLPLERGKAANEMGFSGLIFTYVDCEYGTLA